MPKAKKDESVMASQVHKAAIKELGGLLRENMPGILEAYGQCLDEQSKKYSVGCTLILKPDADGIKVAAKVSYGVKHTDESIGTVASLTPDFFEGKGGTE